MNNRPTKKYLKSLRPPKKDYQVPRMTYCNSQKGYIELCARSESIKAWAARVDAIGRRGRDWDNPALGLPAAVAVQKQQAQPAPIFCMNDLQDAVQRIKARGGL